MIARRFRLLVTGSRDWTDRDAVEHEIEAVERRYGWDYAGLVLVHGAARGLDKIAASVCNGRGWAIEAHPASWGVQGLAAGKLRNSEMVARGADLCLAFPLPGSKGTWDCVQKAHAAGIPVKLVELPE